MPSHARAGRDPGPRIFCFTSGMRGRLKAGLAIAAIAVAVPVASVLGRGAGQTAGPGQVGAKTGTTETAQVHPVAAPSGPGVATTTAKAGSGVKLAYFETKRKTVHTGRSGIVVGPVPKRCLVLNGYYFIFHNLNTTHVLSMGDSPAGTNNTALREWAFYRDNESGAPVTDVKYGIVCLKGAGIIQG
jgi:hypothetical protein